MCCQIINKKNNSIQVWRRRRETHFLTFLTVCLAAAYDPADKSTARTMGAASSPLIYFTDTPVITLLRRRETTCTRWFWHMCADSSSTGDLNTPRYDQESPKTCVSVIIPACQTRFDCYRRHVPLIINPPHPPPLTHTNKHKQHVNIIQRLPVSVSMPVCLFNWARKRLIKLKTSVFLSDELSKDT